ncbi:MAG: GTPase HflX, partial [Rikenellaceae bacterium]
DAYSFEEKDTYDLTPSTKENISLEELQKTWIAKVESPSIFISAKEKTNLEKLRKDLYGMIYELHCGRYPFNNFLY